MSYEYYLTDTLYLIGMNIASLNQGKYLSLSWRELREKTPKKKDNRTGDEIARDVMLKAGLLQGGD